MGFADLHIHSIYSYDGTASVSAILKYAADRTDLDVIAITDHDSVKGIQEAMDLAFRYNLEVVPGCEISSKDGHILGLFIDRPIPPGLSLLETVLKVGERGGICIAAHPMAKGVNSLRFEAIREALSHPDAAKVLIGIEAFNGGLVYTRSNHFVAEECNNLPIAQIGNSDAHILSQIGQGSSFFTGHTALELKSAIINRMTSPRQGKRLGGTAIVTSYIPQLLLRKLGWVSWNESPETSITYTHLSELLSSKSNKQFIHP